MRFPPSELYSARLWARGPCGSGWYHRAYSLLFGLGYQGIAVIRLGQVLGSRQSEGRSRRWFPRSGSSVPASLRIHGQVQFAVQNPLCTAYGLVAATSPSSTWSGRGFNRSTLEVRFVNDGIQQAPATEGRWVFFQFARVPQCQVPKHGVEKQPIVPGWSALSMP